MNQGIAIMRKRSHAASVLLLLSLLIVLYPLLAVIPPKSYKICLTKMKSVGPHSPDATKPRKDVQRRRNQWAGATSYNRTGAPTASVLRRRNRD